MKGLCAYAVQEIPCVDHASYRRQHMLPAPLLVDLHRCCEKLLSKVNRLYVFARQLTAGIAEYLFFGLSGGVGPACFPTCYSCTVGTWNPATATSCLTTCQNGCCPSCNAITGGQVNSNGPMTLGADRFSDTCTCGPGFYFQQSNDQWSFAQYDNTGAKDYLLPCQPCPDGTFKTTADLQGESACISCYAITKGSAKVDNGDTSYEDHASFPVRSAKVEICNAQCHFSLHMSLLWFAKIAGSAVLKFAMHVATAIS